MRKINQEITDQKNIENILSTATICRIGMIDELKPYIIPVNYGYKNGHIYIHSAPEGKKYKFLKKTRRFVLKLNQLPLLSHMRFHVNGQKNTSL